LQINPEYLRRHYATLSDEALLAIDRDELVAAAQKCYDQELTRRGPLPWKDAERWSSHTKVRPTDRPEDREAPVWLEEAACAGTFAIQPLNDAESDAADAREVLEAAGIPCHLAAYDLAPTASQREYRLMVPGKLNVLATSVLDKAIFNAEMEAEWKMHFEKLSDDELRAVEPEILLSGLLDRIERVRKAYAGEFARRKLGPSRYNESS
jgi:hypothetical protein